MNEQDAIESRLTPIKAIRKYCLECSAESVKEVRECNIVRCPLWPYRMGKRPKVDPLDS